MAVYKPRRLRNETEPEQVREPSLYRSLCTSLLSTLLSLVMLVGTTFAWFTESITTGVYTITAGNLSTVTSYCKTWGDWKILENGNKDLFGGMTFSNPDTTQTAYLRLENKGPNPVKYLISFVCDSETAGTLENSNSTNPTSEGKLSELMSFAYTVASDATAEGSTLTFGSSENGKVTLGDSKGKPFSILVPGGSTVFVKLELKLNNYEGTWADEQTIKLRLNLVITQPDNNDLEENNTAPQALQAEPPVTVGEPTVEPVVGPAAEPSTETATAPAAEGTSSAETAQELSSAPETTE